MDLETLRAKYDSLAPALTERSRRLWAATEARALGHGGIAMVERATGISMDPPELPRLLQVAVPPDRSGLLRLSGETLRTLAMGGLRSQSNAGAGRRCLRPRPCCPSSVVPRPVTLARLSGHRSDLLTVHGELEAPRPLAAIEGYRYLRASFPSPAVPREGRSSGTSPLRRS